MIGWSGDDIKRNKKGELTNGFYRKSDIFSGYDFAGTG